jgi:hypothetical protein
MVFRRMRMVVMVFRPRLHYKGARAKATPEAKIQAKFRIFSRPGAIFRRPLDSARALPYFVHGTLLWYCTQHGLFTQPIDAHKK